MNSTTITLKEDSPVTQRLNEIAGALHIDPSALATGCILHALSSGRTVAAAITKPAPAPAPVQEQEEEMERAAAPSAGIFN